MIKFPPPKQSYIYSIRVYYFGMFQTCTMLYGQIVSRGGFLGGDKLNCPSLLTARNKLISQYNLSFTPSYAFVDYKMLRLSQILAQSANCTPHSNAITREIQFK